MDVDFAMANLVRSAARKPAEATTKVCGHPDATGAEDGSSNECPNLLLQFWRKPGRSSNVRAFFQSLVSQKALSNSWSAPCLNIQKMIDLCWFDTWDAYIFQLDSTKICRKTLRPLGHVVG